MTIDKRVDILIAMNEYLRQRLEDLGFPIEAVHVEEDGTVRLRCNQREFEQWLCLQEASPRPIPEQLHQNTSLF